MIRQLGFEVHRLFVLLAMLAVGALANTVTYDTSFNGTGYRLQQVGAEHSGGYSLAVQPDGKVIFAGRTRTASQSDDKFAVIRLNADGTADNAFGSGGTAFSPPGIIAAGWDPKMLLQPDGKILVAATAWIPQDQKHKFIVLRFTAAGVLDMSFNSAGYATANVANSVWDICNSMALGADGKIILVGQTLTVPGQQDWDLAVMRFDGDGSLDTSFDGDGIVKSGTTLGDEEAHSALVQPDGKVVIGGRETTDRERFLLTRFKTDGSIDTSYASGGWNIFQVDFVNNNFTSLAVQSDGKLLGGGGGKVLRFTADGGRDMSFGSNGIQAETGTIEKIDIRVIAGDKFLVATRYGVKRFMPDGAIDTHYSRAFFLSGHNCYMRSLALQADGKAVLGGVCNSNSDNIDRFAVTRFQENRTKRFLDFNGDEKTDISIYRPSNGQWWYLESSTLFYQLVAGQFGTSTDVPVPAEFTGDGRADVAIFRTSSGEWYVLRSDNGTFYSFRFGTSGDVPITGDFDGDQVADAGVYRPSTSEWYIQQSTGGLLVTTFGTGGDKPVSADYDGDFKTDIAIYRASAGEWWIRRSTDGNVYAFNFGTAADQPVPGDYTGDNKTDAAFYRPQTGEWFVLRSDNYSFFSHPFGLSDDIPVTGNYAGDTRFDFVVFRPSTNRWHFMPSGGSYFYKDFGAAGDIILPAVAGR